jgi:hypothetical protein
LTCEWGQTGRFEADGTLIMIGVWVAEVVDWAVAIPIVEVDVLEGLVTDTA